MRKSIMIHCVLSAVLAAGALLGGAPAASAVTSCDGWMMYMPNANFEDTADGTPVPDWCTYEGLDAKGVDRALGWAHSGANDAFIEANSTLQWNSIKQNIVVPAGRTIELSAFVITSSTVRDGYFGVRDQVSGAVYREIKFGPVGNRQTLTYQRLAVQFPSGSANNYTAFIGYWTPGGYSEMMIDDVATSLL